MCRMEAAFCAKAAWRFHVSAEEAAAYERLVDGGPPSGGDSPP